jgi:hypothetical protein
MNFFIICSYKQLFSGFCWCLWGFTVIDINGRVYVVSDLQQWLIFPSGQGLSWPDINQYLDKMYLAGYI